jgi:hypothetical protein
MPPASETTSGLDATANNARISEARMASARAAYEPYQGSFLMTFEDGGVSVSDMLEPFFTMRARRVEVVIREKACWPCALGMAGYLAEFNV